MYCVQKFVKANAFLTGISAVLFLTTIAHGQNSIWTGAAGCPGSGDNTWHAGFPGPENWSGPLSGSTVDAAINLPPCSGGDTARLSGFDNFGNPLNATLNSLSIGPQAVLQVSNELSFTGDAEATLTNSGEILITFTNGELHLVRNVVNSGTIEAQSFPNFDNDKLIVSADGAILQGGGTIDLTGPSGNNTAITGPAGALLTVDNQTIDGTGRIGENLLQILVTSNGIIQSDGTMTLDAGDGGAVNQGTIRSLDGEMRIFDTALNNAGGTIESLVDGRVDIRDSVITGGSYTGPGIFSIGPVDDERPLLIDPVFVGTTVDAELMFVRLQGTLTNLGEVRFGDTIRTFGGFEEILIESGNLTVTGGGTIVADFAVTTGPAGSRLILADQTFRDLIGRHTLGDGSIEVEVGANSVIESIDFGEIILNPGGVGCINSGTIRTASGGELTIEDTTVDNTAGVLESDSLIEICDSTINGGILRGTGRFDVTAATLNNVNNSSAELSVDDDVIFTGQLENTGLIEVDQSAAQMNNVTLTGGGTLCLNTSFSGASIGNSANPGSQFDIQDQTITGRGNLGSDELVILTSAATVISPNGNFTIDPFGESSNVFTNNGRITTELSSQFNDLEIANDTLNNGEMAVVNVGQTLEVLGNLISSQSGVMQGAGRFEADGMILIEGKLEVGTDSQTEIWLDANPIQLAATAETEIELFSAAEFDELILQDVANLGGDLNIVLRDGFVPDSSDNFTIVSNQGPLDLNGEFDNSADGTVITSDGMGVFDVTYGNTTVVLSNFRSTGDVLCSASIELVDGDLEIRGTQQRDVISVVDQGSDVVVRVNDDCLESFAAVDVTRVVVLAFGGGDFIDIEAAKPTFISGGFGPDDIFGGPLENEIQGGPGPDMIFGGPNDDIINAGRGADTVNAFGGNDIVIGGDAMDTMFGGPGDDIMTGGLGGDILSGGNGDDCLLGNAGADELIGGGGDDFLTGQGGPDVLKAGGGDDELEGGAGFDTFDGGPGFDTGLDEGEFESSIEG